ncbi:Lipoprotein signal peptidase [hydrothermal vent metagenome]|uniref:Lipoprotein signal peptidase n=1 Tax=hydrothermal vent metagenome TaxID=652676 RepID=A0A3B1DWF8_9ZZZZ|nr:signal peptidase II [Candidatus Manganitrophaceae bacterium]
MRRKTLFLVFISGGIIILDQITKVIVEKRFELYESIVVLEGFFSLTYILNPGAAFGFLADQNPTFRMIFFLSVSVIALVLLGAFFRDTPTEDTMGLTAISLLFGGAIGNLIDRIRLGEVIDFLDFYIKQHHWPAFNVADSAITIGISLLMFHLFLHKENSETK